VVDGGEVQGLWEVVVMADDAKAKNDKLTEGLYSFLVLKKRSPRGERISDGWARAPMKKHSCIAFFHSNNIFWQGQYVPKQ
jgi:hypothetical protein